MRAFQPVLSLAPRPSSTPSLSRRAALRIFSLPLLPAILPLARPLPADAALQYGKPSTSDLLRKIDREKSEDELTAERDARAAARADRLAKQRELSATADKRRREGGEEEAQADIEANLRANYYYPTGRKRYLPRVKRAFEDIERVRKAVREERWPDVGVFVNEGGSLDDLVLPMRLYASGLSGQGLSLAAGFLKVMAGDADKVEASVKVFRKALKKKDAATAIGAVDDIERAIKNYRSAGKLEAADFGIGEVPKDAKVGSGLGNNNPALYNRNFSGIAGKSR